MTTVKCPISWPAMQLAMGKLGMHAGPRLDFALTMFVSMFMSHVSGDWRSTRLHSGSEGESSFPASRHSTEIAACGLEFKACQ